VSKMAWKFAGSAVREPMVTMVMTQVIQCGALTPSTMSMEFGAKIAPLPFSYATSTAGSLMKMAIRLPR